MSNIPFCFKALNNLLRPFFRLWFLAIIMIPLSACTTVNRGTVDHFFVDTVPQGAAVTLSKKSKGEPISCPSTPCAIKLPRRSEFIATITHPGYEPAEILVTNQGQRASLAGSLVGGTLGGGGVVGFGAGAGIIFAEVFSLGTAPAGAGAGVGAAAVAGPAIGLAAGMVLFDAASGAGLNLAPNPVVLALAPMGSQQVVADPRVALYREIETLKETKRIACKKDRVPYRFKACIAADEKLNLSRKQLKSETKRLFSPEPVP